MPGILPMKVIKVGTNAQSRIAQACDRCRSKKIRCDGIRPCCSQCANVGFECKTSDKLSRRAFPRGYTESLEERVRSLETEVRELKDLLDEKDEKIDMLSRIHSHSSVPIQLPSPRRPSTASVESATRRADVPSRDETFKVQQSPYLLNDDGPASYFAGTSSGRHLIEAFKHRAQASGRSVANIDIMSLLPGGLRKSPARPPTPSSPVVWKAPPRLLSDQLINIYFQEWAPLFPILHRPTFLTLYERYVGDTDAVDDKAELAQLNLVFGIAALSSGTRSSRDLDSFETQWKAAIDVIMAETSMANLQTLILAQLFCIQQGDYTRLLTYKGLSTTISARLGLHQSQKRFALGTLTCETRKKVFWSLYTIDSFTAAILGLPKHLKDGDVQCEYPVDVDDEYVTERGFQTTLPGESTKLSGALALFRASRIISKVLEEVFPAQASYEVSLKSLAELSDELDAWRNSLPPHLRLQFAQDKPSTGTISSRSPLLSLTYHYTRALIYRPPVCASIGGQSSSSMIATASACKHMIQIIELLDERGLGFSLCLNRDEVLVLAGFSLLFQGLGLAPSSKILKDDSKMLYSVIDTLNTSAAPCASDFEQLATSFLPARRESWLKIPSLSRHSPEEMSASSSSRPSSPSSTRKQLKAIASRLTVSPTGKSSTDGHRRATMPHVTLHPLSPQTQSQPSLTSNYDPASVSRSEPARSPVDMCSRPSSAAARPSSSPPRPAPPPSPPKVKSPPNALKLPNLDYLSFGNDVEPEPTGTLSQPVKPEPTPTDWEKLLGSLDNGETNIYDACYGGPPIDALLDVPPLGMHHHHHHHHLHHPPATTLSDTHPPWTADTWTVCNTGTTISAASGATSNQPAARVFSIAADEGLSCGDDITADWASASSSIGDESLRGIMLPDLAQDDMMFENSWNSALEL